jgi:MoaA/NifB/PqqE/SkfB family radical SAM enzyme
MRLNKDNIVTVELDLTTVCNAKCPLCYRNSIKFNPKYMKPFHRSGKEILDQLSTFPNLKTVYLIGQLSEPTTHPELLDIIEAIKQRGLKIKMCTNGDLHNDGYWDRMSVMMDDGDEIWFTFCGSDQKTHAHYRVNTSLERILRHAEVVRKHHHIDCAKCIRFVYNSRDIDSDRFAEMVKDFSQVEYTNTNYPSPRSEFREDFEYLDFLPTKEVYDDYRKIDSLVDLYSNTGRTEIYCQSVKDGSLQIDAFGDVYPCYVYMEAHNRDGWNGEYGDILSGKCDCCRYCNRKVVEYCNRNNRNSII